MPLYEIVLSFPDREEVRLTDEPVSVGDTIQIDHVPWRVLFERDPRNRFATACYLCKPDVRQNETSTGVPVRLPGRLQDILRGGSTADLAP
jgi:hypothetical protein